ncbi:MAG: hypothetical protein AAGE84_27235, partial [Cyanobacteria bacterium P01_G01_bin.39]
MAIIGNDNRTLVANENVNLGQYDSVVAIDTRVNRLVSDTPATSSGIIIGPNHVLTAGHAIIPPGAIPAEGIRVTLSQDVPSLAPRTTTPLSNSDDNVELNLSADPSSVFPTYPNYNFADPKENDIGLLNVSQTITDKSKYMGIVTFVDPKDAVGYEVFTAGYPAGVLSANNLISNNFEFVIRDSNDIPLIIELSDGSLLSPTNAKNMFAARGSIVGIDQEFFALSPTIDTEYGQSGSGFWTFLENSTEPKVIGVLSGGRETTDLTQGVNRATIITTDIYNNIMAEIESSAGIGNADELPENAIFGSENGDEIVGSYRKERILGNDGNDTLLGHGAEDRLEGGDGDDLLDGGSGEDHDELKGDAGNDVLLAGAGDDFLTGGADNDILNGGEGSQDSAFFAGSFSEYSYEENSNGSITFDHVDGTGEDGTDTLRGVEWGLFQDEAQDLDNLSSLSLNQEAETINGVAAATGSAPRIIPLPLTDGVEDTEIVDVASTLANPNFNDLPTPPNIA